MLDRIYRTVNIKDQETQHYYSHLIQHDARQRCPALIVLKEEHNNNNNESRFDLPITAVKYRVCLCPVGIRQSRLYGFSGGGKY